jgi:ubiquinone/menaquinone biosynthesis C-methylase UbiE
VSRSQREDPDPAIGSTLAAFTHVSAVRLEATGIGPGWQCWEVGGGGGSIAQWLAEQCGPSGHVLVTDLDPRFLVENTALAQPHIEIRHHDIGTDPPPAQQFDLAHARLVLIHVPARDLALENMVAALRPEAGW